MSSKPTYSTERLTWDEIAKKYPDTWVGLKDIKFGDVNSANIETAVVAETGDRRDLRKSQFAHKLQMVRHTNPDSLIFQNWPAELML